MRNTRRRKAKSSLSFWSIFKVLLFIALISIFVAAIAYFVVRATLLNQDLENYNLSIARTVETIEAVDQSADIASLVAAARQISQESKVGRVSVYDINNNELWFSDQSWRFSSYDASLLDRITSFDLTRSVVDSGFQRLLEQPSFANLKEVLIPESQFFPTLTLVINAENKSIGVIKSLRNYAELSKTASFLALGIFTMLLISGLWIFLLSIPRPTREERIPRKDKKVLNNQVTQLSVLLDENRDLQRNMKTSNSRAVELNERFLRRVGADLHDGPAQDIGFAAMSLNKLAQNVDSKELGQEFHAIKKALDDSLKEIREISTGLVMPELEQMTLREAVGKVVQRHQINTGARVEELYYNLPEQIPLPIKICAYRFAQEGLNNSHKHGEAKKCKFTAQFINDVLHLTLKDDGIGFRQSELSTDGGHLGLMGLKDRIESLGGVLSINSELGVGTAIKVSLQMGEE